MDFTAVLRFAEAGASPPWNEPLPRAIPTEQKNGLPPGGMRVSRR